MQLPLRLPPPGVASNFKDPVFLGRPVVITAAICMLFVLLFVAARIYARAAVFRRWRCYDYVYLLTAALGLAMIAFSISNVFANGYHAWDLDKVAIPKSSMLNLTGFWIALGPMLWLLKLSLFLFVISIFGSVRWLKNCCWIGIIIAGLVFSAYTIVVTMTCGPSPSSDVRSYLNGLNRKDCSAPSGANAITSIVAWGVNAGSNLYLLLITSPLVPRLGLQRKDKRRALLMLLNGALICGCSFIGLFFRIKSWRSVDITGSQIPFHVVFIIETTLSLMTPCMPSLWVVYRHFTVPDIDDTTTIATPNMRLLSAISSPQTESRATWRKTNNLEELPFRKASLRYNGPRDSRMKALPTTPLPIFTGPIPPDPKTPMTAKSFRSMTLPIMLHSSVES
ncbi:uncharacterized protein EI97DRAFT_501919 [Westerdykella ornata]|uniref:Rhodopsin domain-containing protein n=1 Tax=Westerdykella ornata TaxID=318751 RepID=A0A6A6JGT0_WESOR|nr:uncharacterized protein EI97DRAFT_501919 [Westerdykella ornata]KAF2275313.1 hypothetical protein EI97DRAFT_501919 [Westerdykella ornata]